MIELNKIYCEDSLEGMGRIDDATIDLVFTDPPYNVRKDYGIYKDNLSTSRYEKWMEKVIAEANRISGKKVALFVGSERIKLFWDLLPEAKLIIVRSAAIGPMKGNYFLQYHGLLVTATPNVRCKDLWEDIRVPGEGYFFREKRYDIPGLTSQKLTQKIISCFSKVGGTILDPFTGTGTTPVACKLLSRNWVGFEINPDYIKMAEERLKNTPQSLRGLFQ